MAIIEQTSALSKLAINEYLKNFRSSGTSRSHFWLMKGRIPVSLDKITQPTRFRVKDRLIHWNSDQIKISDNNILTTNASFALNSGAASWFYWYRIEGTRVYQTAGSVSNFLGTGDIKFNSVQVIKNNSYSISGLQFLLETVFNNNEFEQPPTPTPTPPPADASIYVSPTSAYWLVSAEIPNIEVYPKQATWIVNRT